MKDAREYATTQDYGLRKETRDLITEHIDMINKAYDIDYMTHQQGEDMLQECMISRETITRLEGDVKMLTTVNNVLLEELDRLHDLIDKIGGLIE